MQVIGTAGHVDHGKSSLVQHLTGMDPDRFAEEKRRGLTIDLGFAWLTLPSGREVGIVDVPGHERFIKNMLAGAGGVSVCLFVVAATEGWMPQSSEHLAILDVLGVSHGVVAVTKVDRAGPDATGRVVAETAARLAPTSLAEIPIVPCSPVTGEGMDELIATLDEVLASTPAVADVGRPRLWVDRAFTIAGSGTVVTGTLTGGRMGAGDEIEVSPRDRKARIRGIQSHKRSVEEIGPGNRTALNLGGVPRDAVDRGDAVVLPGQWRATRRVVARVRVLPAWATGRPHAMSARGSHLLYAGSAETPVRIRLLDTDRLDAGSTGYAEVTLRDPLPLGRGDRFVLRDAGRVMTIGGGEILDPLPSGRASARSARSLDGASHDDALRALVEAEGTVRESEALLRSGAETVPAEISVLADTLVSQEAMEGMRTRVRDALGDHHRARPLEAGMPREDLRAALELDAPRFAALLGSTPGVTEAADRVRLESHRVKLDPQQERTRADLLAKLESNGFQPPLARELGVDASLLRSLTDSGEIVRIGNFYLSGSAAREARRIVRATITAEGPITVARMRDLLGTSRKYAVPLAEWLDSTGATRRQGDVRALGPRE